MLSQVISSSSFGRPFGISHRISADVPVPQATGRFLQPRETTAFRTRYSRVWRITDEPDMRATIDDGLVGCTTSTCSKIASRMSVPFLTISWRIAASIPDPSDRWREVSRRNYRHMQYRVYLAKLRNIHNNIRFIEKRRDIFDVTS